MIKSFGKTADFKAFEKKSEYMYHIAWAKKIQTEKDEETGEEKELPLCDYWVEVFFYKPRMGKVIEKIVECGEPASMEEIKEIAEGLGEDVLGAMKETLLAYIDKRDSSTDINSFYINGVRTWAKKEERMGFQQNIADKVALGFKEITWRFNGVPITLPCDKAEQLRLQLENYAFDCFNVTAQHRAAVQKLGSVEEAMKYDYKAGYPDILRFNLNDL